ncbi:MAG: hypothetical protein AAF901_12965 [Bacteroidota bacterium]
MHGTNDTGISYDPVVNFTLGYWIMQNQTAQDPIITAVPDINPDNNNPAEYYLSEGSFNGIRVEHFRVNGAWHSWFSQRNHDVDATQEAWKFFSKFNINDTFSW